MKKIFKPKIIQTWTAADIKANYVVLLYFLLACVKSVCRKHEQLLHCFWKLCRHMDTCREPCVCPPVSDKIYIAWTPLEVFLLPCFTVGSTHCVSFTLLLLSIIACWDLSVIILSTLVFSIIHCEMLVYVRPAWECFPLLRSGFEALLNL